MNLQAIKIVTEQAFLLGYTLATNGKDINEALGELHTAFGDKFDEGFNCDKCGEPVKEEPGLCSACI